MLAVRRVRHPWNMAFVATFFLALVAYLVQHALLSPDVQFLAPASDGQWIVHPDAPPGYREAVFVRRFALPAPVAHYVVRVAAMRECRMTVNGRSIPVTGTRDWKRAVPYDIGPLLRAGANEIRVHVSTPDPPPALLVEGPEPVRSDARWTVRLPPDSPSERDAAVAYRDEAFLGDRPNALRASPRFPLWRAALVAYAAFVAYTLIPLRAKPWMRASRAERQTAGRWSDVTCAVVFLVVTAIHLRNAYVYPQTAGFDAVAHGEYVQYVATHRTVPDARQGWEMSQPPLYYATGAAIYAAAGGSTRPTVALKATQFLSALSMLGTIALAFWMLRIVAARRARTRTLGFTVAALLPMAFYLGPQISNEPLTAFVTGAAMCIAMQQAARGTLRIRDAAVAGAACGLALLSKFSGLFVLVAVLVLAGVRIVTRKSRVRAVACALVLAGIALGMSGWFYVRNVQRFGDPFIGAWDRRSGFNIVQGPGYRTSAFYTRFGAVFWQVPPHSRDTSFWDGMYGSMWADSHGVFVPRDDRSQLLSTVCLWLALLPTVAILVGFAHAVRHLATRDLEHPYLVIVVTSALTVAGILSFTMDHPWYSTLKAHWALSLTPCVGVFAGLGLETMCRQAGRLRWLVYANVAALGGLTIQLFWYRGP